MSFKYGKPKIGWISKETPETQKKAEKRLRKLERGERKEKSFQKQIGIKYKKQTSSPQLWETSRSKHIKRGKSFFGIR